MQLGVWIKATFAEKDVVFDLQAIESNDGACKLGNVGRICDEYRSTASCASKSQGVDAPEGQGHLCEAAATKISKAFFNEHLQYRKIVTRRTTHRHCCIAAEPGPSFVRTLSHSVICLKNESLSGAVRTFPDERYW